MKNYLLFLMLGHILADFYFQTEKMAEDKKKSYRWVIYHSLEYAAVMLALAMFVFHLDMILATIYAGTAHFLIDSIKFKFQKKIKKQWKLFLIDQIVHFVSILVMSFCFYKWNFIMNTAYVNMAFSAFSLDVEKSLKWILAILMLHEPTNIMIQKILIGYKPIEAKSGKDIISIEKNAGRMVGTFERIIMIILLYKQQYSALGLVLTAKSITRYNKIADDKAFAEYYLLGTLLSLLSVLIIAGLLT